MRFAITDAAIDRIGLDPALKGVAFVKLEGGTAGEIIYAEKQLGGVSIDDWTTGQEWAATTLLSIRRRLDVPAAKEFRMSMVLELEPRDDINRLDEPATTDDGEAPGPTGTGSESDLED